MDVPVSLQGRRQRLRALHDTGNTLRDPVSGQPVLVLEQDALRELWPPEAARIVEMRLPPEEKMARLTGELSELFRQSHELEAQIREKLGGIGYEV